MLIKNNHNKCKRETAEHLLEGIPVLERYVVKSKQHIVVGDHEDVEKDLNHH